MKRFSVTVDERLLEIARSDVAAGRAPSLSAWVADAMRRKGLTRAELLGELAEEAEPGPYTAETLAWVAQVTGRSPDWVSERLGLAPPSPTRAGRRRN
jgi:hypothetical protein